jgi:hypothetical protein
VTVKRDKIRVLLLDDRADSLRGGYPYKDGKSFSAPKVHDAEEEEEKKRPEIGNHFELRWLATATEAREFRDLARELSRAAPQAMGKRGWVPEIVIFDYALTGKPETVAERPLPSDLIAALSPLAAMRQCAASVGIPVHEALGIPPFTGASFDDDNLGCYAGGLIFCVFSDHPCAPVALTAKGSNKTLGTEAAFFEWMLDPESHGAFGAKARKGATWTQLLSAGVNALRTQIEQLAKASMVQISLQDLLALALNGHHPILTVRSRYGRRHLPTDGLFIDIAPSSQHQEAEKWAKALLAKALGEVAAPGTGAERYRSTLSDLRRGMELADILWEKYNDYALVEKRHRVSLTVHELRKGRPLDSLSDEEKGLVEMFQIDLEKEIAGHGRSECGANCLDIRHPDYTPRQQRWAALMIIIRVVHRRWEASQSWVTLSREHGWRGAAVELLREVDKDDVYLALFPVASGPVVLPWHKGEAPETRWQTLKSLSVATPDATQEDPKSGSKESRFGNLALSVSDVLKGLGWDDDPANPSKDGTHGFLPGERLIMQWYAESLYGQGGSEDLDVGEQASAWEVDDQAVAILKPGVHDDGE